MGDMAEVGQVYYVRCWAMIFLIGPVFLIPQAFGFPDRKMEKRVEHSWNIKYLFAPTIKIEQSSDKFVASRNDENNDSWTPNNERLNPVAWVKENDQLLEKEIVRSDRETDNNSHSSDGQRSFSHHDDFPSSTPHSNGVDGKIIFPDDETIVKNSYSSPIISTKFGIEPMCSGRTFCENVSNYPEHFVNKALRKDPSIKVFETDEDSTDVVQRLDDDSVNDEVLCRSVIQVIRPKAVLNKDNEWVFMVNQDNFKQALKIETCEEEDTQCAFIDGFALGYQTSCKQKYIYRQVATFKIGSNNSTFFNSEPIRLPSSCCCSVRLLSDAFLRMGTSFNRTKPSLSKSKERNNESSIKNH